MERHVTSPASKERREVIFVNQAAKKAYDDLPGPVREMADALMTALQTAAGCRRGATRIFPEPSQG